MFGSTFLSRSGLSRSNTARRAPEPPPSSPVRHSPPRLPRDAVLSLCALGFAASLTVAAFFGLGLLLMLHHPAATDAGAAPLAAAVPHTAPPALSAAPAESSRPRENPGDSPALPSPAPPIREPSATAAHTVGPLAEPGQTAANPAAATTVPPRLAPPAAAEAAHAAAPAPQATGDTPAPPPVRPQLSPAEIDALLARGDAAFRRGDLTSARLFYQRAFEVGEGRGALGLGASYDPLFLRRFHLWNQRADLAEARAWYDRARDLGVAEAEQRLAKLNARSLR